MRRAAPVPVGSPLRVAQLAPPRAAAAPAPPLPVVQRVPSAFRATGALAAAAAATVASTLGRTRPGRSESAATGSSGGPPSPATAGAEAPPPYSANPGGDAPPPYSPGPAGGAPPEYSAVQGNGFDPRALTDFQLDELAHRLIGRITRLIRTELRMDRERIGRLRDPRH
ncbi:extensin [Streptomyces sp. NPDC004561]